MVSRVSTFSNQNIAESSSADLQHAISSNHTEDALQIMRKGTLVNDPLPNGNLPLNYAIRHGKFEIVQKCFELGKVNATSKDAQGLTAVDHALIGKDPKMISLVLGHKIGASFDAAQNKPIPFSHLRQMQDIVRDVEQLRSGTPFKQLPELHEAARSGDLVGVQKLLNAKDLNPYDAYGMTPLHHAVLAGKKEVVQWLFERGIAKDILTQKEGRSLLHLASIGGHIHLISDFLKVQKMDPNATDAKGNRSLHYAMASEDLLPAKTLIQHGADPLLNTHGNISFSPLEMMLALAKERSDIRDPMKLSDYQILMFAGIVASWVSQACGGIPLLDSVAVVGGVASFLTAYKSLKSWKSLACFWGSYLVTYGAGGYFGARFFNTGDSTGIRPLLGAMGAFSAWQSYHVAKNALTGLSSCWKNRSLETYRPIRNAIVHSLVGAVTVKSMAGIVKLGLEGNRFFDAWDKHMQTEDGDTFRNLSGTIHDRVFYPEWELRLSYLDNFFFNYSSSAFPSNYSSSAFPSNICDQKSEVECILALNPECQNQAQKILDFSGLDNCKQAYKKLSLRYHPDKNKVDPSDVFIRIRKSAEMLGCVS